MENSRRDLKRRCLLLVVLWWSILGCGSSEPITVDAGIEQIAYGEDPAQYGWLQTPASQSDAPVPVVVLVHGGFWGEPWDYTLMSPLAEDLVQSGFATWNIEFRRVGGRGGWPQTGDDVASAIDHLSELSDSHNLDLERVLLVGHSSGGHLALWAQGRANPTVDTVGAIGLGAVTDLENTGPAVAFLGGTVTEIPDVYADAAPLLDAAQTRLLHGELDTIVRTTTLAKAEAAGVPITIVADTDHFDVIDPSTQAWRQTVMLISEMLIEG